LPLDVQYFIFSHKSLKITQNRSNPPPLPRYICFRSKFLLTKNKLNPLEAIKYLRKNQKKTKLIFVLATALK